MYDELYQAWKTEKENTNEIQPLPKDFFARLAQYAKRLKEESRMIDDKTVRARLLQEESRNVRLLAEELIRLRYEKAVKKAKTGESMPTESMALEEEKLFKEIGYSAEAFTSFVKDVLTGKPSEVKAPKSEEKPSTDLKDSQSSSEAPGVGKKKSVLRFLQSVPGIIGADMKPYGPFKPEDVASVPVENARVLVKQGLAVEVEVKT